jgi:zinc carboxypeptidase
MSLLSDLPAIDGFPTVDEVHAWAIGLAEKRPERATIKELGTSRNGDLLYLLTISPTQSRGSVLVIGGPHPNEPIGLASVMALGEQLATRPADLDGIGVTWHFVPCADPDGTRLNEGWFAAPGSREHYARHFYRPGPEEQVEWTFPFATDGFAVDSPLPETVALMRAIDQTRPDVLCSLHNAELGGAYYYAGEGAPALYTELTDLCERHGIPLHRGEPETPISVELAPSIFSVPTAAGVHTLATTLGIDPAAILTGGNSLDYASQYKKTFPLVIELPFWCDPRAGDTRQDGTGRTRREVVLACLDQREAAAAKLEDLLAAAGDLPPSPFLDAVRSLLAQERSGWIEGERTQAANDDEYDRPVTVAEAMTASNDVYMHRLRLGGMLLRAIPDTNPTHDDAELVFSRWVAEAAADDESIAMPIEDLVMVQGGAMLATVHHALPAS